jgi:predicted RNase H-like HicB family nuclease
MSNTRSLSLRIHSESDHLWAEVEEMSGCFATGRTIPELMEALEESISIWLAPSAEERRAVKLVFEPPAPAPAHESRVPARAELVSA